ncbi:IS3 family element, transposase orfA [Klebsiella pneumoniae]|nr:IS3 family element, transposase orfA [Klebsiella pneumoniae]
MKKTRYTEEQIAFALKQAETGNRVEKVCRKMGISEATFYNWKKKFGGMGVTELRRLRQLEEENQRLKRLVAPNAFTSEFRTLVISLVRDKYPDFGPTFACEKLRELHELALSAETLRKWMVVYGVSAAEKLPAFISVGNGAHAMANLSRLMVLRMTGLKSEGLAVH